MVRYLSPVQQEISKLPFFNCSYIHTAKYGARNMRRYIQKEVEDRLAEKIIADYTHSYSMAKVTVEGDSISVLCM